MEDPLRTGPAVDPTEAAGPDEIVVATYNVEALFGATKHAGTDDHEFLLHGWYDWTAGER